MKNLMKFYKKCISESKVFRAAELFFLGQQHQRCREKPTALFNLQEIFKKEKTVDFFNKTCYNKIRQMKK